MAKYIISRWEAIELFVKIVAKFEGKSKQNVEDDLSTFLGKYKSATTSGKVAAIALKPIADLNANQNYYPNFLSDLSVEISDGVPISRSKTKLELILSYIDGGGQVDQYQPVDSVDSKTKSLEGSYWWMYSCEYYIDKTSQKKKLMVTRDPVVLNQFGYASMITTKTYGGAKIGQQHYNGQYYIKNMIYLFLDVRAAQTKDKEARAIITIGSGNIHVGEIFTGYYLNAANSLYFGPLLFERIEDQSNLSAELFEDQDPSLHRTVWRFFNGMDSIPYKLSSSYGVKERIDRFLSE